MTKISKKWWRMAEIYKHFALDPSTPKLNEMLDFSKEAAKDMFLFESTGNPKLTLASINEDGTLKEKYNGYFYGKRMMDITIAMWREDLGNGLFLFELYDDPKLPNWWLDKLNLSYSESYFIRKKQVALNGQKQR